MRLAANRPAAVTHLRLLLADPWLQDFVPYRELADAGPSGQAAAERRFPAIAQAEALWADADLCAILMTLVLGRVPSRDSAEKLGVSERILATAEALFFDVRDRLSTSHWIVQEVIARWSKGGEIELAIQLKMAYFAGPMTAQALVDGERRLPSAEADRLVDRTVVLHAKRQALLEFPLDAQRANEFTKRFLDYQLAKERLELQTQKFAHRCEQALRRFELQRLARLAAAHDGQTQAAELGLVVPENRVPENRGADAA